MPHRVAAVVAVPVGVYAVLFVVSLLGGPRIGAPLIPLPGGGGPEAAAPVAGPVVPGQPGGVLPPVPKGQTPAPSSTRSVLPGEADPPCQPGPDHACRARKPAPTDAGPTSPDGTRSAVEPTPGVAERPLPSMPPATKAPPRPPSTQPPSTPPTVTPSGPPEHPKPTTIAEALVALLETLRP